MNNKQVIYRCPYCIICTMYNFIIDLYMIKWYYIRLYKKDVKNMAYHAESQKRYNDKCNIVRLKYTEKETEEYNKLVHYIEENNLKISVYIKELIKKDLDNK